MHSASLTLDQLAALSEEIAALSRAGVPLDSGLRALAHDMRGRVGQVAKRLGGNLEKGQSLDSAVAQELGESLPPAYRTVIAAGHRAGRLPAALEEVAGTARRLAELRRTVGLSLVYPLVVLAVFWGLFLFVIAKILPVMLTILIDFDVPAQPLLPLVDRLRETKGIWGSLMPVVVGLCFAWLWYRSGRVADGIDVPRWFSFGAVGTLYRMRRAARLASLAELLSLLIRNQVPLHESVELASAALGSQSLAAGGQALAEQMRRGERIERSPRGFPPTIAWMLSSHWAGSELAPALARTAQVYRYEFNRRGRWLALYVPLVLTGVAGGLAVIVYALVTLGPWIAIMHRLTQPY
jgi:general secretion pathway protein F